LRTGVIAQNPRTAILSDFEIYQQLRCEPVSHAAVRLPLASYSGLSA
jgi:hypothetical protein